MPLSETVLPLMLLLMIGVVVAGLGRRLPVPYTVGLVILGMGLGALAERWPPLEALSHFQLTPDLVFFVFLPVLIFESGLTLNSRQLIKDIGPVLTLAIPALLISTFAIGAGLWLVSPMPFQIAILFGALISATDPVAVVSLFKELGAPERLTVLVEGESLLNDATAIVMFTLLLGIAQHGAFSPGDTGVAAVDFLKVFLGGTGVGLTAGLVVSWLLDRLPLGTSEMLVLSVVLAFTSFVVAEHSLHVSGVMAVAAAAVTLGMLARPRLSPDAGAVLNETWEFLAFIANTLLFLLVGLSVSIDSVTSNLGLIAIAVVLVLAVRAGLIYSLVPMATRLFRLPPVSLGERHIMWWGGLKGGLAIAIALSIPEDLAGRDLLLSLTIGVVLFTLLVNAPTIRPLIHRLGMDRLSGDDQAELTEESSAGQHLIHTMLQRLHTAGLISRAMMHRVQHRTDKLLQVSGEVSQPSAEHRPWFKALRAERDELESLYSAGLIPRYSFLDVLGELQRRRDQVASTGKPQTDGASRPNLLLRTEAALLRQFREIDLAAGLLSRYQNLRLARSLRKDLIRILMAEAALRFIHGESELDPAYRSSLWRFYQDRLDRLRKGVREIAKGFPDFYRGFESHLATRAALVAAQRHAEEELRRGGIGAKAFQTILHSIRHALAEIPPAPVPVRAFSVAELIGVVPLFRQLPSGTIERLSGASQKINFLSGDTVIAQGERGDALYIVVSGEVEVTQRLDAGNTQTLARLRAGDFFGESALLDERPRTATVQACTPCTLMRLTRRDVHALLDVHPEIAQALEQAKTQRARERAEGLHAARQQADTESSELRGD